VRDTIVSLLPCVSHHCFAQLCGLAASCRPSDRETVGRAAGRKRAAGEVVNVMKFVSFIKVIRVASIIKLIRIVRVILPSCRVVWVMIVSVIDVIRMVCSGHLKY
jgi:hypothetical protein